MAKRKSWNEFMKKDNKVYFTKDEKTPYVKYRENGKLKKFYKY